MDVSKAVDKDIEDVKKSYPNIINVDKITKIINTLINTRHKNECSFWKGRYFEIFRYRFGQDVWFNKKEEAHNG